LFSNFVTTTPWRIARRVCQSQAKEAYDEEPFVWGGKLSKTQHTLPDHAGPGVKDERWIGLRFQEALAWRALRLQAKFSNSNRPNPRVPERQATSQEGRANDLLKQSIGVVLQKPSGKSGDSAEDIGSDASRHHRQPRYHPRAELIGDRRSVADVKH